MSLIEKSFSIIRTNPKLTGNVKLVVDKSENIYLESFSINKILRQERFKHFKIEPEEYYKEVIPTFFDGVENSGIFETKRLPDISEVYDKFRFQFDDVYFSGGQFVEDNWYQEEYEYHAPLYLKRDKLPTDFIILRVDGPGSLTTQSDKDNFRSQIINNWKFVERFDLTDNSNLGKWIKRNFVDDETLPTYPLEIKHGDIDLSRISGLDTKYGGWVTKYQNLKEFQSKNAPIFKTEEFITRLFEDNNVIYPDILNFKFLFDDTPATPTELRKYSINRYLGFYVDEKVNLKSVYSYSGYDLNKIEISKLEDLDAIETSKIPYLKDNVFVQEIDGRYYSFDPIKNGWNTTQTYWVEFEGVFYRLERVENQVDDPFALDVIIGDYLYRVISDKKIEHPVDENITDIDLIKNTKKVIINELSTGKDRIVIRPNVEFNNITAKNLIENINSTYTTLVRNFESVDVNGVQRTLFRISLESTLNNNTFTIPNFSESDLHLMLIEDNYYVIKRYNNNVPNVGGKYYLQTDYSIRANNLRIEKWINNGINTQDENFWQRKNIENISPENNVPFYDIIRINFTDIKDFDFDRLETEYSKYEYEKEFEIPNNIEPKLFAKEYRESVLKINTLEGDYARRIPILDINNRPLNIRDENGELNPFTNEPYTNDDLYFKDENGNWLLYEGELDGEEWSSYNESDVNLSREFYREENYIFRLEEDDNLIAEIDFRPTSDKKVLYEELTWGVNGKSEISDEKIELPDIISTDPNLEIDTNYIPVTSEYITSDELWEIKNNDLTPIWDKNQSICKWGFINSNGLHDYPYRLTYSLDVGGERNREPNRDTNRSFPQREELNLDYFYRFGIQNPTQYQHYNLHLNESYFDIDKYYSTDFDYFEYLFKSDQITQDGLKLTNKYSLFEIGNGFNDAFTLFKGVKYLLTDVSEIIIDEEELETNGTLLIEDIITQTNNKYKNYKFAIIFGRKLSTFQNNPGDGNSNLGFDIYLNDYWKNCVIHIHINTDEVLQITDSNTKDIINAESTPIDIWYQDNIEREDVDPIKWAESEFKINNFGIGLRPRDVMLWEFINILENYNYEPENEPKNPINFIHIYDDGTSEIMDYSNTDFSILTEQPKEFLVKEESFIIEGLNSELIPDFDISNTLDNRIIIDDDPNNPNGDPEFTIDGLKVDSINDVNAYNNYPIAKTINENQVDRRLNWQLEDSSDPSLFRYDGPYIPIFKNMSLFRPMGYNSLKNSTNNTPLLSAGNWKFYDPSSHSSKPNVIGFGLIEELLFSKVNRTSNPLKIDDPDGKERSIYPMVDEYGYDFDARYIFTSNWEPGFNYESKLIDVPGNDVSDISGFTIHYDGVEEYIRIPDQEKYNLQRFLVDNVNFENYILTQPTIGEKNGFTQQIEFSTNENLELNVKLLANKIYQLRFDWIDVPGSVFNVNYKIQIENDPDIPTQTGTKYIHYGEITTFASSWENNGNKFVTNRYDGTLSGADKDYPQTPSSVLPTDYIDNYLINVKIIIDSNSTDITKANLTFKMVDDSINKPNFLLIDVGEPESVDGFTELNETTTQSWKAFFQTENETGNILNYSKGVTNWNYTSTVPINNSYDDQMISNGIHIWEARRGFKTHIPNNPVWVEKRSTPQLVTPNLSPLTSPFNISLSLSLFNSVPSSNYSRLISLSSADPTNNNTLYQQLLPQGFYTFMDYHNRTNPIIRINHSDPFVFEPDRQTYVADGKSIFYSQEKSGELTQPYVILQWYKTYREGFIEFDIIPDNGNTINVKARTRHPSTGQRLTPIEVIGEINNELIDTIYFAQGVTTPAPDSHFYKILIKSGGDDVTISGSSPLNPTNTTPNQNNQPLIGSYYNFNINIKTTKDLKVMTGPVNSKSETTISAKYNKTSLKEGIKRIDSFINEITVEFWVRIDSWIKEYETILYKGEDNGSDPWLDDNFYDYTYVIGKLSKQNKLAFKTSHLKLDGTKTTHILSSESEINDQEWHHVAFVSNLLNKTKSIYIDGKLDSQEEDYLEIKDENGIVIDDNPEEKEMVAQFLENRERFLPGDVHPSLGVDTTLANKIRIESQDSQTLYWYDVIRGLRDINRFDAEWQQKNWGATVVDAYALFEENYKALDYYLNIDPDAETGGELNWDILLGTDSTVNNGKRNFEGMIDELRIWNYARTDEQIALNWRYIVRTESQLDPLNSLVGYYRFDEGQGVNEIKDLMNGKLIKDITRWAKVTTTLIDDGKKEKEIDETQFFQFENSFYEGSKIEIDDNEVDWDVSGANIIGFSDERNVITPPEPILEESFREREQPIFKRTKAMLRKRRKRRFLFNIKSKILNVTRQRSFQYNRTKWWLFKNVQARVKERLKSSRVRFRIRRQGKGWLNKVRGLIKKRRR